MGLWRGVQSVQSLRRKKAVGNKSMRHTSLLLQSYVKVKKHRLSLAISAATKDLITKVIFVIFVYINAAIFLKFGQYQNLVYKL